MKEETVIRYMPLRPGTPPWRWHPDANLVVLCASLDREGREAALSDLQAHWRRECLRVVPDEPNEVEQAAGQQTTIPMSRLPAGLLTAGGG